ncbi:transposase [Micromonospora globbae]|uniref:transposase n=1 Tax=Micromonospora globbae TaxID=1894969 RepID=UPI00343E4B75
MDPTLLNDPGTRHRNRPGRTRPQSTDRGDHDLDRHSAALVRQAAPRPSVLFGVGTEVAAQLITTADDIPDRRRSEAALAHLCGAAPIPASSGRVRRHRLRGGGSRGANHALGTLALPPALRAEHPRLPATTHRRPQQAGNPLLPQALPRPRPLHGPTGRLRCPRPLTSGREHRDGNLLELRIKIAHPVVLLI